MTKITFPKVDEVRAWREFVHDGETFNLGHLDAEIVEYENSKRGPPSYTFYITYSSHCFTTSRPDEYSLGDYAAPKESRPFCKIRYKYSKNLPTIVRGLGGANCQCYHAGWGDFATIELTLDDGKKIDYLMSFSAFKEKKKLRLHVTSAYPLSEPPGRMKKIDFLVIAYNTQVGRKIGPPK